VYQPIGIIHSEYKEQDKTPIQAVFNDSEGQVEVFPEYALGLKGIESFSHLMLIYHFHRATVSNLLQKPFLDEEKERGIFSIRHFNRPNPIGISIVELKRVRENVLEVRGLDILDETPLLDIKPYMRQFDLRDGSCSGWLEEQKIDDVRDESSTPAELRTRRRQTR